MARTRTRRTLSGFTLFELIVVIVIISVLAATFLKRVLYYQEQAEKTAMIEVAGAIQTALILQYGHLLANGRESEVSALAAENPMIWLARKPGNYAGEFFAPTPASVHSGSWVFDLKSRELIYIPALTGYVTSGKDGNKWIRYRVSLQYDPAYSASGRAANNNKEFSGILFEPVEPDSWSS